jgi:two-component system sensor histidine kinase/response regulator
MNSDRDKVIAAGMNDHIAKPIDLEQQFITMARWVKPGARTHGQARWRQTI